MPRDTTPGIDSAVPSSARTWNYWAGGKDFYEVDRVTGELCREIAPQLTAIARASREFTQRAVTHLAGECGVRQFLDVGPGLPGEVNTHEVAQRIAPDARVVYADHDPHVVTHLRNLHHSTPEGAVGCFLADLRDGARLLDRSRRVLDQSRPVALVLTSVLGHLPDDDEAFTAVRQLTAALPDGSYLVHCDATDTSPGLRVAQACYDATGAIPYALRSPERIAAFHDGLSLLEPGIVSCPLWRPTPASAPACPLPTDLYGGVARLEPAPYDRSIR
ncbi:SAM-dependent methyltransferase [Streptomyces sp. NPDC004539]|uniref:SAM-dependent methyltransferase n=1 Tax=Streptomyces sp. NPDC004539 TaxID=3154280 RepID=UPI0033B2CD53